MQYSNKRRKFIWVLIIFLLFILLNLSPVGSFGPLLFVRRAVITVLYPVQYVFSATGSFFYGTFKGFLSAKDLSRENASLKVRLSELESKDNLYMSLKEENRALRESLRFAEISPFRAKLLGADIIGRSPSTWFELIEIDRGSKHGVKKDFAVINENGVVGKVVETGLLSSKVLLLTDPDSSIGGQSERSKDLGVVVGGAMRRMRMNYVVPSASLNVDDVIVTSGIGKVYPKGIPIGRVKKVDMREHDIFKYVEIEPAVNFSRLERVFVILN